MGCAPKTDQGVTLMDYNMHASLLGLTGLIWLLHAGCNGLLRVFATFYFAGSSKEQQYNYYYLDARYQF